MSKGWSRKIYKGKFSEDCNVSEAVSRIDQVRLKAGLMWETILPASKPLNNTLQILEFLP